MPARKEYTPEFKDQAVRFVLEEIEPDESRKQACERLAPKLSMKAVTLAVDAFGGQGFAGGDGQKRPLDGEFAVRVHPGGQHHRGFVAIADQTGKRHARQHMAHRRVGQ